MFSGVALIVSAIFAISAGSNGTFVGSVISFLLRSNMSVIQQNCQSPELWNGFRTNPVYTGYKGYSQKTVTTSVAPTTVARKSVPGPSTGDAFIIPDEVPSLLSLVYSNIPPIKKGTDSRLGFGFRLGPHADFQVLLELGPQTNTDPIGGGEEEPPAKRDTLVISNPYTLVEYFRKLQGRGNESSDSSSKTTTTKPAKKEKISNTEGGKWMRWWKKNVLGESPIGKIKFKKVPGIDDLTTSASENVVLDFRDPTRSENTFVGQLRRLYEGRKRLLTR